MSDRSPALTAILMVVVLILSGCGGRGAMGAVGEAARAAGDRPVGGFAAPDHFVAFSMMRIATAEPMALLDAPFAAADLDLPVATYRRVVIVGFLFAALAGCAGLLSGRRLVLPIDRLASPIGRLASPISATRRLAPMGPRLGHGYCSTAAPQIEPRERAPVPYPTDMVRRNRLEPTMPRRREVEAQTVLSGLAEGVFVTDEERIIVYANTQFLRAAPAAAGGVIGRFCGDVLHPTLAPADRPCNRNCPIFAARSRSAARATEQLQGPDGTVRSATIVSAGPAGGRQVHVLRDETDLEAARRARDSVLANISHEFRTPLAAQLAAIEMLRDGIATLDSAEQEQLLANAERGALRLMRLIDNLLESVRVESGQQSLRRQDVDLEATAQEAAELMRPLMQQNELQVAVDLGALQGRSVPGDSQRLQQVFVNLLSNAAKFAPRGSTIHIGAQLRHAHVETWVEDEGPGLSSDDTAAIFRRFSRGAGTEPDAPGMGLGLWIVRSIVERHHGAVRVERTAHSRTRFIITLPVGCAHEDPGR